MGPGWRWLGWVAVAAACGCGVVERARDPYASAPPAPERPWTPPADGRRRPAPVPALRVAPEPDRVYDLPALIDLAQRANPQTRRSWEQARASAARLGIAESAWLPVLAVRAAGGTARIEDRTTAGPVYTAGPSATSLFTLQWTLLDFGRRSADTDRAAEELLASNLQFNRTHQDVTFAVQRTFYAYDASRARVDAEEATLEGGGGGRAGGGGADGAGAGDADGAAARAPGARPRAVRPAGVAARRGRRAAPRSPRRSASRRRRCRAPSRSPSCRCRPGWPCPSRRRWTRRSPSRPDLAARLATLRAREAEVRRARAEFSPARRPQRRRAAARPGASSRRAWTSASATPSRSTRASSSSPGRCSTASRARTPCAPPRRGAARPRPR